MLTATSTYQRRIRVGIGFLASQSSLLREGHLSGLWSSLA